MMNHAKRTKSKKIWAKIVTKAYSDQKFKEELLKHPENVLKDHEIEIPKNHHINIHEDTETITHLIINNRNLQKTELRNIQGGLVNPSQPKRIG